MSWLEKIKSDLTIKCGDGKSYTPNYLSPQKSIEFNVASFNFPDINGTLVKRKSAMGFKYPVELYFQGEDHLDISEQFQRSSLDPRPWTLSHPYYGELTVHPVSLGFDNTLHNITKITGQLLETISTIRPSAITSPVDKIAEDKAAADKAMAQAYAEQVVPEATDLNGLTAQNNQLYESGKDVATLEDGGGYFDAFSSANSAINSATSEPLRAMRTVQAMISAPGQFKASVASRQNLLVAQLQTILTVVTSSLSVNQKRQIQASAGTVLTTMCGSLSAGEYATTNDVLIQIESLTGSYDNYLLSIDTMQSGSGAEEASYIPDQSVMLAIDGLILFTAVTLFEIAMSAQQEQTIILDYDSNSIMLTHRFYGMDQLDVNLERFVNSNNFGIDSYLVIRAGSLIRYFV